METTQIEEPAGNGSSPTGKDRPFLLSTLCVFAWVSYGLMTLLLLAGILYSGYISEVFNQYLDPESRSGIPLPVWFVTGFILNATAFTGVFMIWRLRRTGFLLFTISTLLLAVMHLLRADISLAAALFYLTIIVLFGIYFRRLS